MPVAVIKYPAKSNQVSTWQFLASGSPSPPERGPGGEAIRVGILPVYFWLTTYYRQYTEASIERTDSVGLGGKSQQFSLEPAIDASRPFGAALSWGPMYFELPVDKVESGEPRSPGIGTRAAGCWHRPLLRAVPTRM